MPENSIFTRIKKFLILNQKKTIIGLKIVLIGLIVLIEWKLNNRIFALFIILFSILAQFIYNKRYFIFIGITFMIFFVFNTSTLDYLLMIKKADTPSFQHPKGVISTIFTPNSGREVLPKQVQNMLSLIESTHITEYKISNEIINNGENVQRIVESAWPVRLEESSPFIFITIDEEVNYDDCIRIDQIEDVILVNCP